MGVSLPHPLIHDVIAGRCSLLLGAGASSEAGFPGGRDLARHLAFAAGHPYKDLLETEPLDTVAQHLYMEPGYGTQWVRNEIIRLFESKHRSVPRPPSAAHALLTRVRWRTIFTTNYDRLVEISYDTVADAVQRILPVYRPDPQIFSHEPDLVRLIKLNGSTDEAQRDARHRLVLTFAEQQDNVSRNSDFYELLRQEAVAGPIVFVGFGFSHPGAEGTGTSPEFLQLRDLLQQLGPAARWHYCIAPFDEATPRASFTRQILKAANVELVNASFGDFLSSLVEAVGDGAVALRNRESVSVPVGAKFLEVPAEAFASNLRQFEVLTTRIEEEAPPIFDSLNGGETWASFLQGHAIEREAQVLLRSTVGEALAHAPDLVFITGPIGWGKTFLLRSLAIEQYWATRPVLWLNPNATIEFDARDGRRIQLGAWDADRIDNLIVQCDEVARSQQLEPSGFAPLIIADNCAERAPEVMALFRTLKSSGRKFVLVFSARDHEVEDLMEDHVLLRRARRVRAETVGDARAEVRALIEFCAENRIATFSGESQIAAVTQRIVSEEADTSLLLALQVIFDEEHRPFSEIVAAMWNRLGIGRAEDLVLRTAALHRLGSSFLPRLYTLLQTFPAHEHSAVLDTYRTCLDGGVLFERTVDQEPSVATLHSLVAQRLVLASGRSPVEVDDALLVTLRAMAGTGGDLEMLRRIAKQVNDYSGVMSTEAKLEQLFKAAADVTTNDWVICQQTARYYLARRDHETALHWAEAAIEKNPDHGPLQHTKGNVLRRWGMELLSQGQEPAARDRFAEAANCFARSRVSGEADEYGFVTHLDMLLQYHGRADVSMRPNLIAEGAQLYREGLRSVPKDKFNMLLEKRFRDAFELSEPALGDLCESIEDATESGAASGAAAAFAAQYFFDSGDPERAQELLASFRSAQDQDPLAWVKSAELFAKDGDYGNAADAIDSALRRESGTGDVEAVWRIDYWDLLIALGRGDFPRARTASMRLADRGIRRREGIPRGYFWKEEARGINPGQRVLAKHAVVWSGRVEDVRAEGGQYGRVRIANSAGESLYVRFNPRYFSRTDVRRGDPLQFVIAFTISGTRADDVGSKPFVDTLDDLYLRQAHSR